MGYNVTPIEKEVESQCTYFNWDLKSEQANEWRLSLLNAEKRAMLTIADKVLKRGEWYQKKKVPDDDKLKNNFAAVALYTTATAIREFCNKLGE